LTLVNNFPGPKTSVVQKVQIAKLDFVTFIVWRNLPPGKPPLDGTVDDNLPMPVLVEQAAVRLSGHTMLMTLIHDKGLYS
jgi:hypothetical protein